MYISQYFTEDDKRSAEQLVDFILEEYVETIKTSTWMDENTKQSALKTTNRMSKYIGYHDKLRSPAAEVFYNDLPALSEDKFLEVGLAFRVISTDREFRLLHATKKKGEVVEEDWTK